VKSLYRMQRTCAALAFALLAWSSIADAQDRSIRIQDYDVLLEVGSDGVLDVAERLTIAFTGSWNGIVRDLSLRHRTAEGRAERLKLTVRQITDSAGNPLRYEEESGENHTRSFRIWVPGANDAVRHVVIRYAVSNAIRFFYAGSEAGELDELYWNVTGNEWDMPIAVARARVVLPPGAQPTQTAVYTGRTGSRSADAETSVSGNTVTFTMRRELAPHEGMTIGVGLPPGHIRSRPSAATNRLYGTARFWPVALPFLVFGFAFRSWRRRGRDPEPKSIAVQYEPVDGLSPTEMGTLVDHRADMRDITATLVDLAVRGFVRIVEIKKPKLLGLRSETTFRFELLRPSSDWKSLAHHERHYLHAVFDRGQDTVELKELENTFYKSIPKIRDAVYDSLIERGYYRERPDKVKGNWFGLAALALILGAGAAALVASRMWSWTSVPALIGAAITSAVILGVFAAIMPARTVPGARAREAALGFREFLSRVETDRYRRMITSPEMFERYLPHAMAFGVEEKWARAFENIYREPPQWYSGTGHGTFSASDFSSRMSAMSSAASSSMSSSPSSSGSGGGGSSGGGSGGGGGSGF
jgi:hypothetical protein